MSNAGAECQHPQQGHLKTHAGVRRNFQILAADQCSLVEQLRILSAQLPGQFLNPVGIPHGVVRAARHHLFHGYPMEQREQVRQDGAEVRCKTGDAVNFSQQARPVISHQGIHQGFDIALINGTQHAADVIGRQLLVTKGDGLVGQTEGITHTAIGGPGQLP